MLSTYFTPLGECGIVGASPTRSNNMIPYQISKDAVFEDVDKITYFKKTDMVMHMDDREFLRTKAINNSTLRDLNPKKDYPNLYATLPADIKYDKTLTYLQKVLYAEICALSNEKGFCYATDTYFVLRFNASLESIKTALNGLDKRFLVFFWIEKIGDRELRKIHVQKKDLSRPFPVGILSSDQVRDMYIDGYNRDSVKSFVKEVLEYREQEFSDDDLPDFDNNVVNLHKMDEKKVKDADVEDITPALPFPLNCLPEGSTKDSSTTVLSTNSTIVDSTSSTNSTSTIVLSTNTKNTNSTIRTVRTNSTDASMKLTLPLWMGRTPTIRVCRLYELLWQATFNVPQKLNIRSTAVGIIKNLINKYSELDAGIMVILHYEWRGLTGRDENEHERLFNAGFPINWIPTSADKYKAFMQNTIGIKTEDDALSHANHAIDELTKLLGYRLENNDEE